MAVAGPARSQGAHAHAAATFFEIRLDDSRTATTVTELPIAPEYLPWLAATGNETTAFPGLVAIMGMPTPYQSVAHQSCRVAECCGL